MAATKAGPRSGIPSRFGYSGGSFLKAPSPATTAASTPNGGLVASQTPKSQLAFNPNRKPVSGLSGRTENSNSSEGLQHVGKHNGYPESLPIKADVYIKPPNSTPNSRLNSPVNTSISGLQAPSKDKLVNSASKLQYSSQLHDLAKRREQSQSPKTSVSDQEPVNDAPGHLASLALADKKRHSSDSTANKYKPKQNIPSPLRESNKIDISQHNSALKPRRGNSPYSTLLKQDKTLNHIADAPSSAFQAPSKFDNRQLLREPAEKTKRLSSGSSGSDDAAVPSAFQRIPPRAEPIKANGSQQKFTGIPRAFSPPPKANSDEVEGVSSKSKIKPQHHILPMSSGLQAKSDNSSAYGSQLQRGILLPRSNANQNNMLAVARATSPPHIKPNMLPRVIKMKNSNQAKQQEDSKKESSHLSDHTRSIPSVMNNGELTEKSSSQPFGHTVTTSQPVSNNTTPHLHSASSMQPPVALVKNNFLDEANDTDSCISETGSESTAATVVMGKKSSIADLTSLDSSSPSRPESSNVEEDDCPELSPPLNADEFPPYFSHDTKLLGKLQNIGFDTGENSPTSPQDVSTQNHLESDIAYSEEDVVTALDAITTHPDKITKTIPSSNANGSCHGNHIATPQMKTGLEPKSSFLPKPKDMEAHKDQSKTMSLPATARYDGLLRFGMKRDKPASERVSPERSTELDGQNVSQQKQKRGLHGLSERRERNKTIAFFKSSEDKGMIKPLGSGLKLQSSGRSEQNLSVTGKTDATQSHSNLKLRALSPPRTSSGLLTSNGSVLKDGKTNLDALRKKTFIRKPTEGSSDITKEKESSLVKPSGSGADHSSLSLKMRSPPQSAFKIPLSGSGNQPDCGQQQIKSPVQQFMVPSPLSPTSPVNTGDEYKNAASFANKPVDGCDSRQERSVNPSKLTQAHQDLPNFDSRKSSCGSENSTSSAIQSYGGTESPSPVQNKNEKDPSVNSTALTLTGSSYDDSNKAQETSTVDKRKSMDAFMSPTDDITVKNWTEGHNDAAGSSNSAVGETSTESIGIVQSATLTDHNLPHVLDDVQRVEIVNNHHKHGTLSVDEPSNDIPPQTDQSSSVASNVVTGVADHSLLNNVVIDKVAASVDSMGSHVDSTAVNTRSSIDRSQYVERLLETEQAATSITLPQLNVVGTAVSGITKQEDDDDDYDDEEEDDDDDDDDDEEDESDKAIISNTLKQSPLNFDADFLADDKSDVLSYVSHVSDRSYTSNFSSFRMKPYMPAHVIAEGSYLEQRKRESFTGNDRTDFLENDRYEMSPQLHHRTPLSKRPNSELEKSPQYFQSDPNLDLRSCGSRSPTYFDRFTPEHQFRDPEVCFYMNSSQYGYE